MSETSDVKLNVNVGFQSLLKGNRELKSMDKYLDSIQKRVKKLERVQLMSQVNMVDRMTQSVKNLSRALDQVHLRYLAKPAAYQVNIKEKVEVVFGDLASALGKWLKGMPTSSAAASATSSTSVYVTTVGTDELTASFKAALGEIFPGGKLAVECSCKGKEEEDKNWFQTLGEYAGNLNDIFDAVKNISKGAKGFVGGVRKTKDYVKKKFGKSGNDASESFSEKKGRDVSNKSPREGGRTRQTRTSKPPAVPKSLTDTPANTIKESLAGGKSSALNGIQAGASILPNPAAVNISPAASIPAKPIAPAQPVAVPKPAVTPPVNKVAEVVKAASPAKGFFGGLLDTGKNLFKGAVNIGKKALGPISTAMDVIDIAKAKPGEERNRAVGSAAGGWAGAAAGGAIGTMILPGVGTAIGAAAGGLIGSIAGSDIGSAIGNFFWGKKKEAPKPAVKAPLPKMPPPKPPSVAVTGSSLAAAAAAGSASGSVAAKAQSKSSVTVGQKNGQMQTVQISEPQLNGLLNEIKNLKFETNNQINVNMPVGAVQVQSTNGQIDYDAIAAQVGQRVAAQLRGAMQNSKPKFLAN
ncbi:hypothetical protein EJP77_04970 [Paenibacillus zeisoli]|uniref:Uncharacterized protein n=1 Tax=Paenibacillus zeisoli TaxID=2496267 RepID=A0A433XQU4_9BACL|nr:hypothetical protein [Paenibacillus zeisoli]RUT36338.1 hypothetical protein EJP77_04970 [Paenibacillus zeisoli]